MKNFLIFLCVKNIKNVMVQLQQIYKPLLFKLNIYTFIFFFGIN